MVVKSSECACMPAWGATYIHHYVDRNAKECTFEALADSKCYTFIQNTKEKLSETCRCKVPCHENVLKAKISPYSYGVSGKLAEIMFYKDYRQIIAAKVPESAEDWTDSIHNYTNGAHIGKTAS